MKIFETIGNFFTKTIPDFLTGNALIIELVLFVCFLLLLFITIISLKVKKGRINFLNEKVDAWESYGEEKRKLADDFEFKNKYLESENGKLLLENEKLLKQCSEVSKEEFDSVSFELNMVKELLEQKEAIIVDYTKKAAECLKEIDNLKEEIKLKNAAIETLKADKSMLDIQKDSLIEATKDYDVLEENVKALEEKCSSLEISLMSKIESCKELEEEIAVLKNENETLMNFKTENEILLKTLRNYKKDDEEKESDVRDQIEGLEKSILSKVEDAIKSLKPKKKATKKNADIDKMKRAELSELAKKLEIKNFATWNNEKLREEIKKHI